MNVFVSFSGRDRLLKDLVVARLRQALDEGDTVWESDEGCVSDYSADSIKAIDLSQVFVIILSASSMDPSSYVFNELIRARQREMAGETDLIVFRADDAPITDRFAFQLNHITDANHTGRIYSDTDKGLDSLVSKVKYLILRRKGGHPEMPFDIIEPQLNASPVPGGGYYVPFSREDIFEEIDEALQRSNIVFCYQLPGYGRRTAAYRYALGRRERFEHIFSFPQFTGTLTEFFLSGLVIQNINEGVFENLGSTEVVLKKIGLLNKLGPKTLLIVPNVTVSTRDVELLGLLSGLECRIIFVTAGIPRGLGDYAPAVSVERMADEYLLKLFFHHYELGSDEERQGMEPALQEFFQRVGGHTKTVEISARVLMDEYIYPEEGSGVLENITEFGEDEVGNRVFSLLSGLFDLKKFDETDQKILLAASLIAYIPIAEEEFTETLRKAGAFSGAKLSRLIEMCWIDRDQDSRTLSMNAVLCNVCLARIPKDERVLAVCFDRIADDFFWDAAEYNRRTIFRQLRDLQRIWEFLDMPGCSELVGEYIKVAESDGVVSISPEKISSLERQARNEQALAPEYIRENSGMIVGILSTGLRISDAIDALKERKKGVALEDAYMADVLEPMFTESLGSLVSEEWDWEDEEVPRGVIATIRGLLVCRSMQDMVLRYMNAVEQITAWYDETESEYAGTLISMLMLLGARMCDTFKAAPYVRLQVLKSRERLVRSLGSFYSASDQFRLKTDKMQTLIDLNADAGEIEAAYEATLNLLDRYENDIYDSEEDLEETLVYLHRTFMEAMLSSGHHSRAEEACIAGWVIPPRSEVAFMDRVEDIAKVCDALLSAGDTEEAMAFLKEALPMIREQSEGWTPEDSDISDALDLIDTMEETMEVLRNPDIETDFSDSEKEYRNYYESFGKGITDSRRMKKYMSAADKAARHDCSGLNDEELIVLKEELVSRASAGEKWDELAPEALALFSEAGLRVLGYPLHYVQYIGALAVFDGNAVEMLNGEGKTYVIAAAAFLHVLYSRQVHVLDTSAYLSKRNYMWMRSLFESLGCRAGILKGDNGHNAAELKTLSESDVIYGLLYEMGFMAMRRELGQRDICEYPLRYDAVIADEGDRIFFPDHETMNITGSAGTNDERPIYQLAWDVIGSIDPGNENCFTVQDRNVTVKPAVYEAVERRLGRSVSTLTSIEAQSLETALKRSVYALYVMQKDRDYYLRTVNGVTRIMIENIQGELGHVDSPYEFLLLKKEGFSSLADRLKLIKNRIVNSFSVYEFLKSYTYLSGASATFSSLSRELKDRYGLDVFTVPPNAPVIRRDEAPLVYCIKENKYRAIVDLVIEKHSTGQPVLLICQDTYESKHLSAMMTKRRIVHRLYNAVNADDNPDCLLYAGEKGMVTVTTPLANRGVDICLGGNPSAYAKKDLLNDGIPEDRLDAAVSGMEDGPELEVIRKRYSFLKALYWKRFSSAKKEVEDLGGLCVIGTTCFDDMRTEQQMRGRSGRQGSPGESHVFYSYEDEPLKKLLGSRYGMIYQMMKNVDDGISVPVLNRTIHSARLRLQHCSFSDPKKFADVMYYAEARKIILGPVAAIRNHEFDLPGFLKERISGDKRYRNDFEALKWGDGVKPGTFMEHLVKLDMVPGRFDPALTVDLLMEAARPALSDFDSAAADGLVTDLTEAWAVYLGTMEEEIAHSAQVIRQDTRRLRHLAEFSRITAQRLFDDAVEAALVRICSMITVIRERNEISEP